MAKANGKCTCNFGWAILAWIFMAVGIWSLVAGFATQFTSLVPTAFNAGVLGWYFVGVLLIFLAKKAKWNAWCACKKHKM